MYVCATMVSEGGVCTSQQELLCTADEVKYPYCPIIRASGHFGVIRREAKGETSGYM